MRVHLLLALVLLAACAAEPGPVSEFERPPSVVPMPAAGGNETAGMRSLEREPVREVVVDRSSDTPDHAGPTPELQAEQPSTTAQPQSDNASSQTLPPSALLNFSIAGMHLDWSYNQSKGFMRSLSLRFNNYGIAIPENTLALEVVVKPSPTEDAPVVRYRLPEIPAYREALIRLPTPLTELRESVRYDRDVKYAEQGIQYDIQRAVFALIDLATNQQLSNTSMNITLVRNFINNPHDSYLRFFSFTTAPQLAIPSLAYNDTGLLIERASNEQNISVLVQSLSSAAFPKLIFDLHCEEADAKRNFYAAVHRLDNFASGAIINITLAKQQSCAKPTILARESLEPKFGAKSSDLIMAR